MSWDLVYRWNNLVKPGDRVIHLGDFFCCHNRYDEVIDIIRSLNGDITLIPGNHDYQKNLYKKEGIEVINDTYLIVNDCMLSHYPKNIISTPRYKDGNRIRNIKNRLKKIYKKYNCQYHFYGHDHARQSIRPDCFNVACDLHDYSPILVFGLLD